MDKIDLFPTRIFKFKIDPEVYNKEHLVDTLIKNYKLDPTRNRNNWDDTSELHHYYNDWNNTTYDDLPLSSLQQVYDNIIRELMEEIQTSKNVDYQWTLENVTVNAKHMAAHDHVGFADGGMQSVYSGIHYIKFNKDVHNSTMFLNPLTMSHINCLTEGISQVLNPNSEENSSYYESWNLNVIEDDFIFFPAYLKHKVLSSISDDYRITSVVNLRWKVN